MKRKQIRDAYALVMLTEAEKKRLLQSILSAKDQSLTERKGTMKRWSKKTILIAAVITALVIFMGCAVAALSTQKLKLDEYRETSPAWIDAEGKRHEAAEVTKTVLSLQGIENTPEQMAAKEWYDFCKSYDPKHDIYMASQGKFQAPEEYGAYDVYSQEMVEKLTQIAQKYSLKLSGRKAVAYSYDWKLGWDALGLPDSLVSGAEALDELRGCSFYDSGSFALWMEFQVTDPAFTWKHSTHLVLNYKVKGYLDTDVVDLVSGANMRQWNYTRSDGQTILVVVALDPDQPANDRLLLICDREEEISAFIPEEYWEISAKLLAHQVHGRKLHFTARLATLDGQKAVIANAEEAQKAVERIQKAHFAVNSIKMSEKRKMPAAPFTTSSLQQEASRKLGFTTAKTMQVVQQLYEGIDLEGEGTQGIVSYIRTDSVRISDEALNALREYIPERFGSDYLPEKPMTEKCPVCGSYMVEKRGRKGEVWHLCANETCHHRIEVQASEEEADE